MLKLLLGAVAIISVLVWLLLNSHEANGSLEAQISRYKASNVALAKSVERAIEEKRQADEATAKATLNSRALQGRLNVLIKDYDKLGEQHETVKAYYNVTIPHDVLKLMCQDGRCERGTDPEDSPAAVADD